jgi:predicted MFS family arabinose efflux permease
MKIVKKIVDNYFHSLTNANFRYFWLGQCISLIGTWMQMIGQAWLVYKLTNSALLLGIFTAMQFLPITTLTLFMGVLIDRYPKKKILLITQTISMLLAFALAALVFTGTARYEYILVIAILLGITNSIDNPTRQSFLIEIAGRDDLMNAIALNSAIFNSAKILGPALGAVLLSTLGAGWCFLINGLSFIAVLYGLLKIKVNPYVRENKSGRMLKEVADGLRYIYKDAILFRTVVTALVMGIFSYNYNVIIPVFVTDVLHQEATGFGILMASLGIGSVFGALTVSGRNRSEPKTAIMIGSAILVGILYIVNGFSSSMILSVILLALIGVFSIYFSAMANTLLQFNSKDEYRGRVMSVNSLTFSGATPIGSIFVGVSISRMGAPQTFMLSGVLMVLLVAGIAIVFYRKRKNSY